METGKEIQYSRQENWNFKMKKARNAEFYELLIFKNIMFNVNVGLRPAKPAKKKSPPSLKLWWAKSGRQDDNFSRKTFYINF